MASLPMNNADLLHSWLIDMDEIKKEEENHMNAIDKFYAETIKVRKLSYRAPEADGKKIREAVEALEQLAREYVVEAKEKQAEPA